MRSPPGSEGSPYESFQTIPFGRPGGDHRLCPGRRFYHAAPLGCHRPGRLERYLPNPYHYTNPDLVPGARLVDFHANRARSGSSSNPYNYECIVNKGYTYPPAIKYPNPQAMRFVL